LTLPNIDTGVNDLTLELVSRGRADAGSRYRLHYRPGQASGAVQHTMGDV
jgi:hypothetical protein